MKLPPPSFQDHATIAGEEKCWGWHPDWVPSSQRIPLLFASWYGNRVTLGQMDNLSSLYLWKRALKKTQEIPMQHIVSTSY